MSLGGARKQNNRFNTERLSTETQDKKQMKAVIA